MSAIRATYHTFKLVPSRSVAQIVLEIKIEDAEAALDLLGIPQPGKATWCAVAILRDSAGENISAVTPSRVAAEVAKGPEAVGAEPARPAPHPLVQMAGILPNDERFIAWLSAQGGDDFICTKTYATQYIRQCCGIETRKELATNDNAAKLFTALLARYKQDTGQSTWERPA